MADIHEVMMITGKEEQPLFTINPSMPLYFISIALIFFIIFPIILFGITLPVLITGSFDAIWPVGSSSYRKPGVFFSTLIFYFALPLTLPHFRVGKYFFYENRLEIKTYLFGKKYVFEYDEIHTIVIPNNRIVISRLPIPEWFESPIKLFKSEYLNGFYITLNNRYYEEIDIAKLYLAIDILKQKTVNFTQK